MHTFGKFRPEIPSTAYYTKNRKNIAQVLSHRYSVCMSAKPELGTYSGERLASKSHLLPITFHNLHIMKTYLSTNLSIVHQFKVPTHSQHRNQLCLP